MSYPTAEEELKDTTCRLWKQVEITDENECVGGHVSGSRLGTEIEYRTKGQSPIEKSHKLKVEIIHTHNGTANSGLFCKYCILDAFARLDDRPRVA